LKGNKSTKQSRKSTASTKSADNGKIPRRSKQARLSVADNSGLGVLQQTLSDYFKDQMQSTRDLSRQQPSLKKIEGMLQKHLEEMKKMYQKEVKEQIGYF